MRFEEVYNQYIKYIDLRLKVQSKRSIKNRFKVQIIPYWKDYDIYNISEIDYLNWQLELNKKGYSYKYKQVLHISLVTFFNYCIKFYKLNKNVASIVGGFKKKEFDVKIYDYYTYDEFKRFIDCVDSIVYKQLFTFMFFTGVRPGEAMALRFSDLNNSMISINKTLDERNDPNTKIRTINSPKTFSSRRIFEIDSLLNNDLLELKNYYSNLYNDENYDYYLFGGLKPLSPSTINRYKLKACERAKIRPIKLHEFRHSHATLLVENNLHIKEISRRLGHSNTQITLNIYVHTNKDQEKRVINTLNSLRLN